jgi:hypothetical protein
VAKSVSTIFAGKAIAAHKPSTDFTYDNNGVRIGSGNRLPGLAGKKK